MSLEQQAINIITSLPADKLSQVITFAKFLLTQPETDSTSGQVKTKAKIAFNSMRQKASINGFMTDEEIEAEISDARQGV